MANVIIQDEEDRQTSSMLPRSTESTPTTRQ